MKSNRKILLVKTFILWRKSSTRSITCRLWFQYFSHFRKSIVLAWLPVTFEYVAVRMPNNSPKPMPLARHNCLYVSRPVTFFSSKPNAIRSQNRWPPSVPVTKAAMIYSGQLCSFRMIGIMLTRNLQFRSYKWTVLKLKVQIQLNVTEPKTYPYVLASIVLFIPQANAPLIAPLIILDEMAAFASKCDLYW